MLFKSKRILPLIGLFWIGLVLVACTQVAGNATSTTQPATATPQITPTPFLTPTNTPDPKIISPANASQIVELGYLNKGGAYGAPLFSPDGKWLFQASTVGVFKYDTATYSKVTFLGSVPVADPYGLGPEFDMNFSADQGTIQTGKGNLVLMDGGFRSFVLDPLPGFRVQPHFQKTTLSPNNSYIASYYSVTQKNSTDRFVVVWKLPSGKLRHTFEGEAMAFSADNRLIAVQARVQEQYFISLYDLKTGEKLDEWPGEKFTFLQNNRLVVESGGYVRVFDVETHKAQFAIEGGFATFSPDQQMLAVVSSNQIQLYRVSDGVFLRRLERSMPQFDYAALKFSANGEILAGVTERGMCCGGSESLFSIWQVADGLLIRIDAGIGSNFALSPDGETLAVWREADIVEILRTTDGSLLTSLGGFSAPITNLAFTPDGKQIVTATNMYPNIMRLYDIDAGPFGIPQIADKDQYQPLLDAVFIGSHEFYNGNEFDYGTDIVISPDGKFSVQGSKHEFKVSDEIHKASWFSSSANRAQRFAFSPDSQLMAVGLGDGSVELWDIHVREKLFTIPPRVEHTTVGGLAFSPDGRLLAVGLSDGTLRLFGIAPEAGLPPTPSFASIFPTATPSVTPSPVQATPSPTTHVDQQNPERWGYAVLPSQEELATLPSLWDLKYTGSNLVRAGIPAVDLTMVPKGSTDLSQPGTKFFRVTLENDQPLLLPWLWCAKTDQMAENLEHLQVELLVNGVVPDSKIVQYASPNPPAGFECRNWVTKIIWGVEYGRTVSIRYTLDETISDGVSTYPAGVYKLDVQVTTEYEKRLMSENYGFSFAFSPDISIRDYNSAGDKSIFYLELPRVYHPSSHIGATVEGWVEAQTDRCHPRLIGSEKTPVEAARVILGGNPFNKVYTPHGTMENGTQDVEYMIAGTNFCVHLYVRMIVCSNDALEWGCLPPNNVLPEMQGTLDRIVSSFRWEKP